MKLPGRTPILVELDAGEYAALSKESDSSKLSMTLIVRGLIREHLMKENLVASWRGLSKRFFRLAEESTKQAVVFHLADDEYKFLTDYSGSKELSMTHVIRNLIRKYIMNANELPATEN